jgi:hypothetical protein
MNFTSSREPRKTAKQNNATPYLTEQMHQFLQGFPPSFVSSRYDRDSILAALYSVVTETQCLGKIQRWGFGRLRM